MEQTKKAGRIRVIVCGAMGRLGSNLCRMIDKSGDFELSAAIDIKEGKNIKHPSFYSKSLESSDISIDFSAPDAAVSFAEISAAHGKPIVIATTGLSRNQMKKLEKFSKRAPVFFSPNMSSFVILLVALSKITAAKLSSTDISIVETHHKKKKDMPSGTALLLKKEILKTGKRNIEVQSIRAGDIRGEHTVIFAGQGERIELVHRAQSIDIFALGALRAAKWLLSKGPGFYNYFDIFSL